jgi:hypothetical protein
MAFLWNRIERAFDGSQDTERRVAEEEAPQAEPRSDLPRSTTTLQICLSATSAWFIRGCPCVSLEALHSSMEEAAEPGVHHDHPVFVCRACNLVVA